jgi:hypothetical protein
MSLNRMSGGAFRGEVDVHRGVGIDDYAFLLTADAGELLVSLEHGARLRVIEDQ